MAYLNISLCFHSQWSSRTPLTLIFRGFFFLSFLQHIQKALNIFETWSLLHRLAPHPTPRTFIYTQAHKCILSLIHRRMHTCASISIIHLFGPLSSDIQYDLVFYKCTRLHVPLCTPVSIL